MPLTNYIPDVNRFHLAGPPDWWLKQLLEFDNSLAVVPSRQGFYYRLAQRRKLNLPERIVNEALFNQSDTRMLASYSLVPVTTIVATANWSNPLMFKELSDRAPWRNGGADKVNAILDAQEIKQDIDTKVKTNDHLTYLSKDAWNLYRKAQGLGRSWNTSPQASKTPLKRVTKHVNRSDYYPGFGGGF